VLALATTLIVAPAGGNNVFRQADGDKIHWSDDPGGGPGYVTLVDKTGSNWLVQASASNWDAAGRLNIIYQYGDCGGYGHCVSVDSNRFDGFTCRDRGGFFDPDPNAAGHLQGSSRIEFNQKCADNDGEQFNNTQRRVIVCQEEGHAVGDLDHDFDAGHHNTCMAATGQNFDHPEGEDGYTGRRHDFEMLDDVIYDHDD
jgi:hypothetical protein